MENFEKNIELFDYFASDQKIKEKLAIDYKDKIQNDEVYDIVFFSSIYKVFSCVNFNNITRSNNFLNYTKEFSKINIIPVFENVISKEYIGFDITQKRFVKIGYKQPANEDFLEIDLYGKQAYKTVVKSSDIYGYPNTKYIKEEYNGLLEKIKSFVIIDKDFKKFLTKTTYEENFKKRKFVSRIFAFIKLNKLWYILFDYLKLTKDKNSKNDDIEQFAHMVVLDWLNALLRI